MGALLRNWTCNSVPQVWHKPLDATWKVRKKYDNINYSNAFVYVHLGLGLQAQLHESWCEYASSLHIPVVVFHLCRTWLLQEVAPSWVNLSPSLPTTQEFLEVCVVMISDPWVHRPLCTLALVRMFSILPPVLLQIPEKNRANNEDDQKKQQRITNPSISNISQAKYLHRSQNPIKQQSSPCINREILKKLVDTVLFCTIPRLATVPW